MPEIVKLLEDNIHHMGKEAQKGKEQWADTQGKAKQETEVPIQLSSPFLRSRYPKIPDTPMYHNKLPLL